MAVARPIRMLALLAAGLWVFFIYQIFGPTRYPKGPGDTLKHMERDPNLDRTLSQCTARWMATDCAHSYR
jgi:mannosyltransferase